MRKSSKAGESLESNSVDKTVAAIFRWQQDTSPHDELCKHQEEPCQQSADHSTDVLYYPQRNYATLPPPQAKVLQQRRDIENCDGVLVVGKSIVLAVVDRVRDATDKSQLILGIICSYPAQKQKRIFSMPRIML